MQRKFSTGSLRLPCVALNALVFTQVVSRYIFNSPISWTEEMARILFVWICFMGTFLALKTKGHIAIETLLNTLFQCRSEKLYYGDGQFPYPLLLRLSRLSWEL